MKPKEICDKLGIDRNRINYYKEAKVFSPDYPPSGNRATNYTEADYEALKLLEVLTKSGLTCSDIKKMQDGEKSLSEFAIYRIKRYEDDIIRKKNSILMLSIMVDNKEEFERIDVDRYWNIIHTKEEAGDEFIDVDEFYEYQTFPLTRNIKCPNCGTVNIVNLETYVFDESSYETEHGMGPDCVYSFNTEDFEECKMCGGKLNIEGWIREYPLGAYDSESINVIVNEK